LKAHVLTRGALEAHRLKIGSSLLEGTPVDAVTSSEDHDLVEELVDLKKRNAKE
jgi:hypothetical protein